MTNTGTTRPDWRERWTAKENERRQRAHAAAMADWRHRQDLASWMLTTAREFAPAAPGPAQARLGLTGGESLYWAADSVTLVESAHQPGLHQPDHRDLLPTRPVTPAPPVPGAPTGQLAVTGERVVFLGSSRREWAYSELTGLVHTPDGRTMMEISNREQVSGLRPPPLNVHPFQLFLTLALADRAGDRDSLVAHLQQQLDEHRRMAPPEPTRAIPEQAPASARWGGGTMVAVAASLAVVLAVCCAGAALLSDG